MNALIFTDADAQHLIAAQTGQHRLAPVQLTDGRRFLMADVLDEPLYAGKLDGVNYETAPFDSIAGLIPAGEDISNA
jgi:hypothetical protein